MSSTALAQVNLPKGKKKRVLEVEGTLIENGTNVVTGIGAALTVSGIQIEPLTSFHTQEGCSTTIVNCTAHGEWWIDLEKAEASNPGLFIGQPLTISLRGSAGGSGTETVSLRARMAKP